MNVLLNSPDSLHSACPFDVHIYVSKGGSRARGKKASRHLSLSLSLSLSLLR